MYGFGEGKGPNHTRPLHTKHLFAEKAESYKRTTRVGPNHTTTTTREGPNHTTRTTREGPNHTQRLFSERAEL